MANDDDIEALLAEIDHMNADPGSNAEKSVVPAKKGKEVDQDDQDDSGLGRFAWGLIAGAGGAGLGLIAGVLFWVLPWVGPVPMALGGALGAAVAGFVSGPPKWLDD